MNQFDMTLSGDDELRTAIANSTWCSEDEAFDILADMLSLRADSWARIADNCGQMIHHLRSNRKPPLIDQFLTEYGLSTDEGVQLMRLAEALSRTVDPLTANDLIRDKIQNRDWLSHSGTRHSFLMSFAGRALHLTDKWLRWSGSQKQGTKGRVAALGDTAVRFAARSAIKALSSQFVFAETLEQALRRARRYRRKEYLFSFDMLGEAARTQADSEKYYQAYTDALDKIINHSDDRDSLRNHGISVKLSALHPRYEFSQSHHVVPQIVDMMIPLAIKARAANIQITIDAEEAERLDISMDVLAALAARPELKGWNGLGFVVQAYQRRALPLIDWLQVQSTILGAPLFIRLVKGAYWDSEIKRAQEMGLESYPVYTRKEMTDLSYLACAKKLLARPDCFHPQFATHNAHSIAAIRELANSDDRIEFQRLFGMGQQLHDRILLESGNSSRIYAPVGTQKDLLSYLIRRLLENGANSSFVNKLADPSVNAQSLTRDPISLLKEYPQVQNSNIPDCRSYLQQDRMSAKGWDLSHPVMRRSFQDGTRQAAARSYRACSIIGGKAVETAAQPILNPASPNDLIGEQHQADTGLVSDSMIAAETAFKRWSKRSSNERASVLERAAELLEERASVFHYLAIKEAGKTWSDAVDEVREAVDFCRYYAERIRRPEFDGRSALGVIICISPWNFPLAIFMGQACAALAAGNTVVAKPAEQTPLIAAEAVRLLHDAGVDPDALNFLPGEGHVIGEALVLHPTTAGVCFTGSTSTAKRIAERLAATGRPLTPLIAETGGINAMIVDSSALLEQTVDTVISSAFQSAGQRCSALRILCVQNEIADDFDALLSGALDTLRIGDPDSLDTDIGPVIDQTAQRMIQNHISRLESSARRIGMAHPKEEQRGHFVTPVAYGLEDFSDLQDEIFGPVLHVIRFDAKDKAHLIEQINARGYGLTMGIDSRIDASCDQLATDAKVGNIYINRNQIGAVVGVQPFGGAGLSGTGPKAGGPLYLNRLSRPPANDRHAMVPVPTWSGKETAISSADLPTIFAQAATAQEKLEKTNVSQTVVEDIASRIDPFILAHWRQELEQMRLILPDHGGLPSPAGETNEYRLDGRGLIFSLVHKPEDIISCCIRSILTGNSFLQMNDAIGSHDAVRINADLELLTGINNLFQTLNITDDNVLIEQIATTDFDGIILDRENLKMQQIGLALARRMGAILPIFTPADLCDRYVHEKTVTCNIAAAGGDISLLNA